MSNENIAGLKIGFEISFDVTEDEAWEWADQQSIATIHDIAICDRNVIILPLWESDFTKDVSVNFMESFFDFFAEKQQ